MTRREVDPTLGARCEFALARCVAKVPLSVDRSFGGWYIHDVLFTERRADYHYCDVVDGSIGAPSVQTLPPDLATPKELHLSPALSTFLIDHLWTRQERTVKRDR